MMQSLQFSDKAADRTQFLRDQRCLTIPAFPQNQRNITRRRTLERLSDSFNDIATRNADLAGRQARC
jgi:hypothetical protein